MNLSSAAAPPPDQTPSGANATAKNTAKNPPRNQAEKPARRPFYRQLFFQILVAVCLGILVGFDAFDSGHTAEDGILWQLASLVPAILSCALHSVRHHQMAVEEDVIIAIVEERVGTFGTARGTVTGAETTGRTVR